MERAYSPYDDYCEEARRQQSVPSREDVLNEHPDYNEKQISEARGNDYSCADNYQMGTIQDDHIFIATTDSQHDQICNGEKPEGLSGYFSDQETVDSCSNCGVLDNTAYNDACQIKPYRQGGIDGSGDAAYKPHVDCFRVDHNALMEHYGTTDFNAAIAKCEANNQFGAGGGNQGYNPRISEMIENGSLVHEPQKSFSDSSISNSTNLNANELTNSIVPERDYVDIMHDAQIRNQDCINNNTPNPSSEARENGFPHNPNPIQSDTCHATPVDNNMSCLYNHSEGAKDPPIKNDVDMSCLYGNSGNNAANDVGSELANSSLSNYGGLQ
jgi:hypothetical protein